LPFGERVGALRRPQQHYRSLSSAEESAAVHLQILC
jgi:hypothetical protein